MAAARLGVAHPERVAALRATGVLDVDEPPGLRRLTGLASRLLRTPTALVSLVLDDRQVFVSQVGLPEPWAALGQTPLSHSFCQHVVDDDAPLVVSDARENDRLRDNLAIPEIGVVAYAGMPIRVDGRTLGSFCAIDGEPREWTPADLAILEDLAAAVSTEIELVRAARHAEETSAVVRRVLEVSQDACVSIDADGVVLEWNPAAEALFGWSRAEATGTDLARLIIPPEHRDAHYAGLARVRATNESKLAGQRIELPAVARDGRAFPVEFTLQATRLTGRPVFHAFLHDISERRAAEQQLRRQAELIDAAPAAIIVRTLDGTILSWNHGAEQMYGWPAHEAVGRDVHQLLATGFPDDPAAVRRQLIETGRWAGELTHRRADGTTVVALSRHVLRPDATGRGHEVIETDADITGRRRAEDVLAERNAQLELANEELQRANLLKLDLMGMLSHDIGTPLAAILGYGELLTDDELPDPLAGPLERIKKAAHRIDELRHNVLAMCTLNETRLRTHRSRVELPAALRDALDAADEDVPVTCPAAAAVLVNPAHLRQILVNFLTNARKYGGGATAVVVTTAGGATTVAIHDQGPGVPAALREHLFERYTRADDTRAEGHGLGLHIVASLAEANSGSVGHRPGEPRGSVFTLSLESA